MTTSLTELYNALKEADAKRPRSVRELSPDDRRAYDRQAKRLHRERQKQASSAGSPFPTEDVVRQALSDAALMLLSTDAPGSEAVRSVLAKAFPGRPGVPSTMRARAKAGTLRPKLLTPDLLASRGDGRIPAA